QTEEAIAEWKQALDLDPADAKANYNFGLALLRKGTLDEAIAHFRTAVEAKPEFSDAQGNLGAVLLQEGRLDEAIPHLQEAVAVKPQHGEAQSNLGIALLQKGRLDEAIVHLQQAVEINPKQAQNHLNLGNGFYLQGKTREALEHWHEGLRLDPNHVPLLSQTAWVLATRPEASIRNRPEAVKLAQRAVEVSGGEEPAILDTLAAARPSLAGFRKPSRPRARRWPWLPNRTHNRWPRSSRPECRFTNPGLPFEKPQKPQPRSRLSVVSCQKV